MPAVADGQSPTFLCIKTGKFYTDGMIAYLGIAVPSEEILAKATTLPEALRSHLSLQLMAIPLRQLASVTKPFGALCALRGVSSVLCAGAPSQPGGLHIA